MFVDTSFFLQTYIKLNSIGHLISKRNFEIHLYLINTIIILNKLHKYSFINIMT